jgi:hypothetical protein
VTAPGATRSRRRALLLACAQYDDPTIPRLRSPERDAEELATVLADETRGRYEVRTEVNPTVDEARVAIEQFLSEGRRDDLLLVYFSCHGILDAHNELHLAFRNTRQNLLHATGLSREWVHALLNEARPQSSVVLVDCCFSGAFVYAGLRSRAARRPVDIEGLVRDPPPGKARAVLTASAATQLSFEDEMGRAEAAARPSYFTEAVIAALRTGAADRDRDGRISVDDLYVFVYDRVTRAGHGQEPQRAIYGAGELVIAYAGQHEPEPPLPPEPPDSAATLLISPDMLLPPWPPLPGDAAAPRRPLDHPARHHRPPPPPAPLDQAAREAAKQRAQEEAEKRQRRRRRRRGLAGIAVALAVAVAVGGFFVLRSSREWLVDVPATRDWTATGVDCEAGRVLEITATGTIHHNNTLSARPGGDPHPYLRKFNIKELPNANHAALIGSVDRHQPYFLVGEKNIYSCRTRGGLLLGINDVGLTNNSGKFVVTIRERKAAGP